AEECVRACAAGNGTANGAATALTPAACVAVRFWATTMQPGHDQESDQRDLVSSASERKAQSLPLYCPRPGQIERPGVDQRRTASDRLGGELPEDSAFACVITEFRGSVW